MRSAILVLAAALAAGQARAEGYALDLELLHGEAALAGAPGVRQPFDLQPQRWTVATLVQLERDPLILYDEGHEIGVLLDHRAAVEVAVAWDARRVRLGLALPLAWQGAGDFAEFAAAGVGLGDPALGLGLPLWERRHAALGLHGGLRLPLGRQDAWLGEAAPRATLQAAGRAAFGLLEVLGDGGVQFRRRVETTERLNVENELFGNLALRLALLPDEVALTSTVLVRRGLGVTWQRIQNSSCELLGGAQLRRGPVRLDAGAGRGFSSGYGATEFRAYVGLTWQAPPPRRVAAPGEPIPLDLPLRAEVVPGADPEEPAWEPTQLARIHRDRIEIRDPLQFSFDTAQLLPISRPTLEAVARILLEYPEILRISVVGHASEEGSFAYNYDLSNRRAGAVVRALVEAGVHPARLSCRGMGEVAPVSLGLDEASLAPNRRVVFQILDRADPLDPIAAPTRALVPWTGAPLPAGGTE